MNSKSASEPDTATLLAAQHRSILRLFEQLRDPELHLKEGQEDHGQGGPQRYMIGGRAAGLLTSVISGGGLATSLVGASVGAGLLIGLVLLGGMGIGDAWLMAAIGAWTSWHFVLAAAMWASLAGGLFAVVALVTCPKGLGWRQPIYPYVPAIAVGATVAWFLQ
jgi:prepilin signal peptidase PulO-like enzyme (type II secretory pathway)